MRQSANPGSRGSGDVFRDRVAIVTGGGSGIGAALVRALAARGTAIVIADIDEAAAKSVAAEVAGVTSVTPALTSPNGKVQLATVYPASGPQAGPTIDLVNRLETEARAGRQGRIADHLTRLDLGVLDELGVEHPLARDARRRLASALY